MTKWPVSAAASAAFTVSVSRISPTRMTSGSCRIAARSAVEKSLGVDAHLALVDHRELVEVQHLDRVLDRDDVHLAVVVDVVDHAGERRRLAGAGRAGDEHQAARLQRQRREHRRQAEVLERDRADARPAGSTRPHEPRDRKTLTRNRPTPGEEWAKSASLVLWNSSTRSGRRTSLTKASVSAGVSTGACSLRRRPSIRTRGGDPTLQCRSDPPHSSEGAQVRLDGRVGLGGHEQVIVARGPDLYPPGSGVPGQISRMTRMSPS